MKNGEGKVHSMKGTWWISCKVKGALMLWVHQ